MVQDHFDIQDIIIHHHRITPTKPIPIKTQWVLLGFVGFWYVFVGMGPLLRATVIWQCVDKDFLKDERDRGRA